jgi:hypothetical protein
VSAAAPKRLGSAQVAEVLRTSALHDSADGALTALLHLAVDSGGWSSGSITEVTADSGPVTMTAVEDVAPVVDLLQRQLGEGPMFDAISSDPVQLVSDLAVGDSWPRWSAAAIAAGVRSLLVVRLFTDRTIGTMNLYSTGRPRIDDAAIAGARMLAAHASVHLAIVRRESHLLHMVQQKAMIGRAQGMLMQKYGLDENRAYRMLSWVAQQNQIEMAVLAERFTMTGILPLSPAAAGSGPDEHVEMTG